MSDARSVQPPTRSRSRSAGRSSPRKSAARTSPRRSAARSSPRKSAGRGNDPAARKSGDSDTQDGKVGEAGAVAQGVKPADGSKEPSLQDAMRGEEAMRRAKQAYLRRALLANGGLAALATPGELARMGVPRADYLPLRRSSNLHVDIDSEVERKTEAFRDRLGRQLRQEMSVDPTMDRGVDGIGHRSSLSRHLGLGLGLGHGHYDDDDDDAYLAYDDDYGPDGLPPARMPGYVLHTLRRRIANLECSCGYGCGPGSGCLHLAALRRTLLGCGGCSRCDECGHVAAVLEMMRTCGQCSHVRQYRDDKGRVMFEL